MAATPNRAGSPFISRAESAQYIIPATSPANSCIPEYWNCIVFETWHGWNYFFSSLAADTRNLVHIQWNCIGFEAWHRWNYLFSGLAAATRNLFQNHWSSVVFKEGHAWRYLFLNLAASTRKLFHNCWYSIDLQWNSGSSKPRVWNSTLPVLCFKAY